MEVAPALGVLRAAADVVGVSSCSLAMEVDSECRNYRLRLGLPELSQPFFGSWLSPDSTSPPSSFFFDSFPPSQSPSPSPPPTPPSPPTPPRPLPPHSNSNGSHVPFATESLPLRIQEEDRIHVPEDFQNNEGEGEGEGQTLECRSKIEYSILWLDAGRFKEGQSIQQDWEVTHLREEMLRARSAAAISGKIDSGTKPRDLVPKYSDAEKGESRASHFIFDSIQVVSLYFVIAIWNSVEHGMRYHDARRTCSRLPVLLASISILRTLQESDLVRAALRALQGVPTAISWLEQLAVEFSSKAADRSSENFTTLWTRSSSSCSLSKVLTEFAKAGRVACQLDYFTSFFLNQLTYSHVVGTNGAENSRVGDSGRKKRKRQNFITERSSERHLDSPSEVWEDLGGPNISPHCHTNQAFAVAVKTFMQGNLASLDKIRSSVNHRRQVALGGRSIPLSEVVNGEAGLVFGFGCGDVTLLELFLHSHKQREQLQALAALCRINEGDSLVRLSGNHSVDSPGIRISAEDVNIKSSPFEMETHLFSASRNAFNEFPRGADLLSYLFAKLSVADTLHLELIRFLFERACQPYMVFIRSWLYLATVQDPFGEFFVKAVPSTDLTKRAGKIREQDALLSHQIPNGVIIPCFLEEVCTPLLRAGQQLQVLSKLLDTPSASKFVDSPFKSSGSFEDTQLSFLHCSEIFVNKSTLDGQVLVSSRKDTQGDEQQFKRSSQMFKNFQDASVAGLSNSPPVKRSEVTRNTISSNGFWLSGVEDRSGKKTWTTTEIREANAKSCQETMARAALLRAEGVDDISIISPTGENSSESFLQSCTLLEDKSKELHAAQCLKSRLLNQVDLLNSESDSSFISNFQRGTSWPVLGLPKNPFLSSRDEGDQSFSYTYTVFPENNGCWDVNIHWNDTHSVTGTRVQSATVQEDWPTSESRFVANEQKVDGDHSRWLKNLEDYMRKQLTSGLDEQILEVDYASFNCQFENDDDCWSAHSLGFQPWDCSMRLQKPSALQRNAGRRLQVNSYWEFVDSSIKDTFEKQFLDDNFLLRETETGGDSTFPLLNAGVGDDDVEHKHLSGTDFLEVEDEKSPIPLEVDVRDSVLLSGTELPGLSEMDRWTEKSPCKGGKINSGACYIGTGARWESHLHSEYHQIADVECIRPILSFEDDEEDEEEIPLSVAVKQWIDEEILYQYKRTSMLTIRLLQERLHLQDHFAALRRYYFMERGDWAEYFLSALCKYEWNRLGGEPQLLEVQSMLGTALQNSSCEGDEFADRLYVVQSGYDGYHSGLENPLLAFSNHQHSLGTFVDCNKLEAFDFIKVGYKVEWPLCLIITPSAISRYSSIFTFLLRLKLTIGALADVWRSLQVMGYSLNKGRRSSDYQEQNRKFRTLQHFRQQIGHVVTTLQRYTESQILHAVWSKFHYSVEMEVNDIQDLEKVHSVYLDDAYHHCFLSRDMEDAKNCIDIIMQCTLDFRNTLLAANLERSRGFVPVDDEVFHKVLEVKSVFEVHLQKMYSFHQRPEPQYSVLLSDFWMCLNYNGCLKPFRQLSRKEK